MGSDKAEIDVELADLYTEYRYHLRMGGAPGYDEQSAHKSDWWVKFEELDDTVRNELQRRENAKREAAQRAKG